MDACALRADFDILVDKDMTEIGEKGINLSGGQKQRVSLARAIYSNRDIYLLDDPLSAVDSHVGKHIFDHVIGPGGLLKNKTRLLVTNQASYLPKVDYIIVVKNGRISEDGTYTELLQRKGDFAEFLIEHIKDAANLATDESNQDLEKLKEELEATLGDKIRDYKRAASVKSNISSLLSDDEGTSTNTASARGRGQLRGRARGRGGAQRGKGRGGNNGAKGRGPPPGSAGRLMQAENLETTSVKSHVYVSYAKAVGVSVAVSTLFLMILNQIFSVGTNFWLAAWSDDPDSAIPKIRNTYLGVYGALGGKIARIKNKEKVK